MKHNTQKCTALVLVAVLGISAACASEMTFEFGQEAKVVPTAYKTTTTTTTHYTAGDMFTELIMDLLAGLWIVNNITVTFESYPYAQEGKYLIFGDLNAKSNFDSAYTGSDEDSSASQSQEIKSRVFRFAADTAMFWMNGFNIGNETRFEGYLFKFFGPVFENTLYCKNAYLFGETGNDAGNLRLGGELALVQTNMLSAAFLIQWDHWYGSLQADGINIGFIIRSYPVSPLLLEWRTSWHCLDENYVMWESILEAGVMVWRNLEVFASWRHLDATQYVNWMDYTTYDGVSAGVRVHF
ncbi:MAG: hypothetical protein IIT68_05980 [Treponema sp.]|nr:hypothetical protein [Treponema sp.]